MKEYKCWYGLGGGFGGARDFEIEEFDTVEEGEQCAWELACDYYENYEGLYGLRSFGQIAEEEGLDIEKDEDEINEIYNEEREPWLDYYVEEVK